MGLKNFGRSRHRELERQGKLYALMMKLNTTDSLYYSGHISREEWQARVEPLITEWWETFGGRV